MASFDVDAPYMHPLDFDLLQNGPIALFRHAAVMSTTVESLRQLGYSVIEVDASRWDEAGMFRALAQAFAFPDYFGNNLNALHECLEDVAEGVYGWSRATTGLAVVVRHYDAFWTRDRELAQALADAAVRQARYGLLFGHRIAWLLQASDHAIAMDSVGCEQPVRPWPDESYKPEMDA